MSCSSDLFIKIWDVQNEWKNTKTFPGHEHTVSSVRFMPGDQQVVSASRDRTIRIFDIATTSVISILALRIRTDWSLVTLSGQSLDILTGFAVSRHRRMVR